jgi:hypothetical protein
VYFGHIYLNPISIGLAAGMAVLPLRWQLRVWGVLLLALAGAPLLIEPQWSIFRYYFGFVFMLFFAAPSVVTALRVAFDIKGLRRALSVRPTLFSVVLAAGFGAAAASYFFLDKAWRFAAREDAIASHLLIFAFAGLGAGAFIWLRRRARHPLTRAPWAAFALSWGLALAACGVFSLTYGGNVLASAAREANGAPYCIALNTRNAPAHARTDLTFLTMDKGVSIHHAMLYVQRGEALSPFHWSYRQGRFAPGIYGWAHNNGGDLKCAPRHGFAAALPLFARAP